MHGMNATEPTPVDTFRVISYLLQRKSNLDPGVAAKHMRNVADVFEDAGGPELVKMAEELIARDVAAERGET